MRVQVYLDAAVKELVTAAALEPAAAAGEEPAGPSARIDSLNAKAALEEHKRHMGLSGRAAGTGEVRLSLCSPCTHRIVGCGSKQ